MARIQPFRGFFYNHKLVGPLAGVITPPYDVLSLEEQERLHSNSPYNIVRLEQGLCYPDDSEHNNRYTRAAHTFNYWIEDRILVQDEYPSFYLYEQSFDYGGSKYFRKGVMAALRLEPFGSSIFPHERTMAAPKADRFELLKHLKANISPIFLLMRDPDKQILGLYEQYSSNKPAIETTEIDGQTHRIWKITDQGEQRFFSDYAEKQKLLIADGHHRYETALKYSDLHGNQSDLEASYVLVTLVSSDDPGLLMLPTHRLLKNLDHNQRKFINELIAHNFKMLDLGKLTSLDPAKFISELSQKAATKNGIGYINNNSVSILIPKDKATSARLPVELLHEIILEPLLKPDHKTSGTEEMISYPHDLEQIIKQISENESDDIAFVIANIEVNTVWDRALKHGVMPQKTTFFYPKLPGGLVLRSLDHV
jgi:uncharacterized protein (DUF1015 family)